MRLSRKSCCTWRVKPSGGRADLSTITVLASGMAAHAGVARLMYVMGRDGVFPKSFFGYVHPKWRTPAMNIILVGAIALLAINFDR